MTDTHWKDGMLRPETKWFERHGTLMTGDAHYGSWRRAAHHGKIEYRPRLGVWDATDYAGARIVRVGYRNVAVDAPSRRCATLLDAAAYLLSPHRREYDPNWKSKS